MLKNVEGLQQLKVGNFQKHMKTYEINESSAFVKLMRHGKKDSKTSCRTNRRPANQSTAQPDLLYIFRPLRGVWTSGNALFALTWRVAVAGSEAVLRRRISLVSGSGPEATERRFLARVVPFFFRADAFLRSGGVSRFFR